MSRKPPVISGLLRIRLLAAAGLTACLLASCRAERRPAEAVEAPQVARAETPAPAQVEVLEPPLQAPSPAVPRVETPPPAAPGAQEPPSEIGSPALPPVVSAPAPSPTPPAKPKPPVLSILAPREGSYYASLVTVRGMVGDSPDQPGAEQIASVRWEIPEAGRSGEAELARDGRFSFSFSTIGFPARIRVRTLAASRSGETARKEIVLLDDGAGPALKILNPEGGTYHGLLITVRGQVQDTEGREAAGGAPTTGEVASVTWRLEDGSHGGDIRFDTQGRFTFDVPTAVTAGGAAGGASGGAPVPLRVRIRALDKHGHETISTLSLTRDASPPVTTVDAPADGERYGSAPLQLRGRVADVAGPQEVRALAWRLVGAAGTGGLLPIAGDGSFSLQLDTGSWSGPQTLELRAEDLTGNASVTLLSLRAPQQPAPVVEAPGAGKSAAAAASREPPPLIVSSPPDRSFYRSRVGVTGKTADEAASLDWQVAGTTIQGRVRPAADGSFSFDFPTIGLHGTQALHLSAAGRNGLQTEKVLVLLDQDTGPLLSIRPATSYYRQQILLEGAVANPGGEAGVTEVKSVTYQVQGGSGLRGPVVFQTDGSFKVALAAEGLSGTQTVELAAEDLNGHLSRAAAVLLDGNRRPTIVVRSPQSGTPYGSKTLVAGEVIDPYADVPDMRGIEALTYTVRPVEYFAVGESAPAGQTTLRGDNSFSLVIDTRRLRGAQDVVLTALARTGNQGIATIRMEQGSSDIPSFGLDAGDGAITVRWDPLPAATGYALQYKGAGGRGAGGTERRLTGIRSPYVLRGLRNGELYSLQLSASVPGEQDSLSAVLQAMPFASDTLQAIASSEFEQIQISWNLVPGAAGYDLLRSASPDGPYGPIAPNLAATAFTDREVQFGTPYYYRVQVSGFGYVQSRTASAQTLPFPAEKLTVSGTAELSGIRRIRVSGGYAYLAAGSGGLRVVDIAEPGKLVEVGSAETAMANDVAVRGEYVYVADGERGLKIFDVTDPRHPALLGSRKTSDARGIALDAEYAFVADGSRGIKVLGVGNPLQPEVIGYCETGDALAVAVQGAFLYVAAGRYGLKVVDVSNPGAPVLAGELASPDARNLAVDGPTLCLADGQRGLRLLDLSDPRSPADVSTYAQGRVTGVELSGDFAYLVDEREGVQVIDLWDRTRPVHFATFKSRGTTCVAVQRDYAYTADASGLHALRVVMQGSSRPIASCGTGGGAHRVTIARGRAYVAGYRAGVAVLEVSDPKMVGEASLLTSYATEFATDTAMLGKHLLVADGVKGLKVIDTTTGALQAIFTGGEAGGLASSGSLALVADRMGGVKIVDLSDPEHAVEVGSIACADARDVDTHGTIAYVAGGPEGLLVYDVSEPTRPVPVSRLEDIAARRLVWHRERLYVVSSQGLQIVDVSNPANPVLLGVYGSPHIEDVAAAGPYAYLAEGHRGLTVLDVTRPERPFAVSTCSDVYAVGLAVTGGYALVANSTDLQVIQVLIPEWLKKAEATGEP